MIMGWDGVGESFPVLIPAPQNHPHPCPCINISVVGDRDSLLGGVSPIPAPFPFFVTMYLAKKNCPLFG